MKYTFIARGKEFSDIGTVDYTPLIYTAGTVTHRLALHHETGELPVSYKQWAVSHPTIGAKILNVTGSYKGMPCSSARLGVREARMHAIACLDAMLERIGSDKFNATIATQLDRLDNSQRGGDV